MRECRYQGECEHENHNPCYPVDDVVCKGYQPMPDVQALLALADELERAIYFNCSEEREKYLVLFVERIREAVGA